MTASITRIILVLSAILLIMPVAASASWVENGTSVCTYAVNQFDPLSVPDGSGGVIVAWKDYRNGNYDIFVQRINALGEKMWSTNGIPICTLPSTHTLRDIATDCAGGAIITWDDYRSGIYDIYAQRIDSSGVIRWTPDGALVCGVAYNKQYPRMISDDEGGAIIAWEDNRNGNTDIYAQRITSAGAVFWDPMGKPVCTDPGSQFDLVAVTDGAGGIIIAWEDYRSSQYDIYTQRLIGTNGNYWWAANGIAVCTAASTQSEPEIAAGLGNDAIITWMDYRNGNWDVFAQRVTAGGSLMFAADGIAVCDLSSSSQNPVIVSDGEGGAYIAWMDYRSTTDYDVYAARIDIAGNFPWTVNGIAVCAEYFNQEDLRITAADDGGFIAVFQDYRYGGNGIGAQKVNSSGSVRWGSGGVIACMENGNQNDPTIVPDGAGGALMAWEDGRSGDYDIYAQRVERNGYWGYPAPAIESVRDVPGDQGGYINLAWDASRLDPWPEDKISYYYIWRALDETVALSSAASGTPLLTGAEGFEPGLSTGSIRADMLAGEPFYWELIETVNAYNLDYYSKILETSFDSTAACTEYHYFQVTAHYSSSIFWISAPDSGYSVDNLAPAVPLGLAGEQIYSPEGLQLTWDPNSESDLADYNIYRGTSSGFIPGPGNFVTSTPDTVTFDGGWTWEAGYWYKVAAVDIHGNESPFAVVGPDAVTGDDPMPAPDATFLAQNWPNPFNPNTTIAFGLKANGYVSLRIYDAAGRLVSVLIDESRPAGQYTAEWNGKDRNGNPSSSGIYFYMLKAGPFEETRKMVLLR